MPLIMAPCDVGEGGGTAIPLVGAVLGELEEDREGVAMVDDAGGSHSRCATTTHNFTTTFQPKEEGPFGYHGFISIFVRYYKSPHSPQ